MSNKNDAPPAENQPTNAKQPLNINVNAQVDGTVQLAFGFPVSNLNFEPIEALGLCMAIQHAVMAVLQKEKGG